MTENEGQQNADATTEAAETAEVETSGTDTSAITATESNVVAGPKLWVRIGAAAGGVLLVGSIASSVYFYLQYDKKNDALAAQSAARDAACAYAPALVNYEFNNLDPYFANVLNGATGDWKSQFEAKRNDLGTVLMQGEVTSKVTSVHCAIETGDSDHADAIVVIGQTVTNVGTEGKPQPGQMTMVITFDNVDGRWLASKINAPELMQ